MKNFTYKSAHERARYVILDRRKGGNGNGGVLPLALPFVHFLFQEGVALLLHVEVDDASEFFLPNFESVYVDVIADVPEKHGGHVTASQMTFIRRDAHSNDFLKLWSCCSSL